MARRWTVNPPMGQVIGGWIGAMIVLGIAGGWLFAPTEVTLHTVPLAPETATSQTSQPSPGQPSPERPSPERPSQERPAAPAADAQPAGRGRGEP